MKSEEQDFEEWRDKSNSKFSNLSRNIKPIHLIALCGAFFVFYYLYSIGKINFLNMFGGLVLVVGILIILATAKGPEKVLIPEHIIKQIAYNALDNKRKKGIEIPFDCKIKVSLQTRAVRESDLTNNSSGIVSRQVACEILRKSYSKKYIMFIEPYNGTILDFVEAPLGFSKSSFSVNKKVVPVSVINAPDQSVPNNRGL